MKELKPLQILAALEVEDRYRKSPSMPKNYIIPTKWTDKTANGLTSAIIKFLQLNGHQAERINNLGRRIDKTQVVSDVLGRKCMIGSIEWQKGSGARGTADISSIIKPNYLEFGVSVKIEVKINKDKQSDKQRTYENNVNSAGGVYIIAKTFDGFYNWYMNFMNR